MPENNPWSPPAWLGEPSNAPQSEEPFTLPAQEVPRDLWFPARPQERPAPKPARRPRSLAFALPFIILFGLLSAFFSWVSAEPLWLAVGHGTSGTATVTRCVGEGMTRRCLGDFTAREFAVTGISVLGLVDATPGTTARAHMVSERSQRAYAGGGGFVLRWLPGLTLVMLCGLAIAMVTGVRWLTDRRERWAAFGVSMAGPFLVTVGFLAASF
ncbi:hypothetical protein [Allorhizocola rhizosphaerae]|uniref:hypothetical protein n=1 Tax=Allorhizocola rhizosphaerae TaxID=1872709 RepID=UPI000E3CAF1B|nr:hypothetical protein [Allorhizocola rhizosphaerae]